MLHLGFADVRLTNLALVIPAFWAFTGFGVKPGEIALLPRGVVFKVDLPDGPSRGYVCENYGAQFRLPELGPIGSNGLANARDFQAPVAAFQDASVAYELVKKSGGRFWSAPTRHSPFNVVAWHGNLAPVKYDTANFMTIGSISFDHPDPSIFTVLTSPSDTPGTANCDFVIFPPRWLVMEDTFRPPWYHRNLMSEFMGLVYGEYDAKPGGFKPGGASLHNCMVPHGPDEEAFEKASHSDLKPQKLDNTLAFMFESRFRSIDGVVVGRQVKKAGAEVGPVVVVSHRPDDFRTHGLAGGVYDGPEFCVRLGLALVSEVASENHGFGPRSGSAHFVKELLEQGVAVDHTMQWCRTAQQVGVTQME